MGYNIELRGDPAGYPNGDVHATDLCTTGGYSALCDWIDSLPPGKFPALSELSAKGTVIGTDRLADEIERAVEEHRPDDEDTVGVADRLHGRIGVGVAEETISVKS